MLRRTVEREFRGKGKKSKRGETASRGGFVFLFGERGRRGGSPGPVGQGDLYIGSHNEFQEN